MQKYGVYAKKEKKEISLEITKKNHINYGNVCDYSNDKII